MPGDKETSCVSDAGELSYSRSVPTLTDQTKGKTANASRRGSAKFDILVSVGAGSILGSRLADESAGWPKFGKLLT